jgi:hypothetical protein
MNVLPLNANVCRYSENVKDKFCFCCKNVCEDEAHVIFDCPLYVQLRLKYLKDFVHLPLHILLNGTNSVLTKQVAKFIFQAMKLRRNAIL